MHELLRSNDLVLISYVGALLDEASIGYLVLDGHMSVLEGSLGVLQRRVLVEADQVDIARRIMRERGLAQELRDGSA
jgi:hypothetical protein